MSPTRDPESVALAWARQYLAGHHCDTCGKQWITRASVRVLVHECSPPTSTWDWRPPRQRIEEDRQDWARRTLGDGLIEAVEAKDGTDSLLRRVDDE
jgi:hypothetical protein